MLFARRRQVSYSTFRPITLGGHDRPVISTNASGGKKLAIFPRVRPHLNANNQWCNLSGRCVVINESADQYSSVTATSRGIASSHRGIVGIEEACDHSDHYVSRETSMLSSYILQPRTSNQQHIIKEAPRTQNPVSESTIFGIVIDR